MLEANSEFNSNSCKSTTALAIKGSFKMTLNNDRNSSWDSMRRGNDEGVQVKYAQ